MTDTKTDTKRAPLSESEKLLFSGALRHDKAWAKYSDPLLRMSFWAMARQFPGMLAMIGRIAWREDPRALAVLVAAQLASGAMSAFLLVATNQVLVHLFADGPTPAKLREALPALLLGGASSAGAVLLGCLIVQIEGRLYPKIELSCRTAYYGMMTRVEMSAMEDKDIHRQLALGQYGTDSVRRMLSNSVSIISGLMSLGAAGIVLAALHPLLVAALLLIAAPRWWGAVIVMRRAYASQHAWIDHRRATDVLLWPITRAGATPELRVHGAGRLLIHAQEDMGRTAAAEKARLARAEARTEIVTAAMSGTARIVAYGLLWWLLVAGGMPLAAAGTAVLAIRNATGYLNQIVSQLNRMCEESLYLTDMNNSIRLGTRHAIPDDGVSVQGEGVEVVLQDVTFRYPGAERDALREVSLTIPKGKVVALVGENGSGKTTLANLIAGLYLPAAGTVSYNGVDVREANRESVFDRVALLPQDVDCWPMTVRANIHIGDADRPLDQGKIEAAAERADIRTVVEELPHGWDSIAVKDFERGVRLSGGQWQRIGVSRAVYRERDLLIVDEPTAALDPKAEIEMFESLRSFTDDGITTVLLITHRLAATATADVIYVLNQGRLLESGAHAELMALTGGHYRELYELQAAQYGNGTVPAARKGEPAGA
ncbi:ABC transporter ATP-binding protein/permease [Streptomyces sp. ET3-23]|uniref:ABC transporter ATP-binding protein n=1 Tax=Streptomyces sp. ET3-23 TaxID=2885643 RepID=UPI001D10D4A4|nr:ABC transporter ATP-binding protein [Streptomyces sp. ET3-23]MCC2274114.1 ABC transporter ATP-binding protein/permease [Streptomyces sp. ET3-23]